jgi:3-hydroxybutyryl-CoA dehydrogenase
MGRGIAEAALLAGHHVILRDARPEAVAAATDHLGARFEDRVARGRLSQSAADEAKARLLPESTPLAAAGLAIEAIVEDAGVKRVALSALEAELGPQAVLATNTSSLLVGELAAGLLRPGRLVGLHFFNPVPAMPLVELVGHARSDASALDLAEAFATRLGKTVLRAPDVHGFLVNQLGRAYVLEAARLLDDGVASAAEIDRTMRLGLGFRMGPFELMDLTGLDVTCPATLAIRDGHGQDPRYSLPGPMLRRWRAGLLGSKTGTPFAKEGRAGPESGAARATFPLWLGLMQGTMRDALATRARARGAIVESGTGPSTSASILVPLTGESVLSVLRRSGFDPARTLGIDALFGWDRRPSLLRTEAVSPERAQAAAAALAGPEGAGISWDCAGGIAQRILGQMSLIAGRLAATGTGSPADIDTAARLALGYPVGPFERLDAMEPDVAPTWLETLFRETGEPRFRPESWLLRRIWLATRAQP